METPALNTIPTQECWRLLTGQWFARVALSIDALPTILPVEYRVDGNELALCLGQYRLSDRVIDGAVVGFAADAINEPARTGWTVRVQGRTRPVHPFESTTRCGQHEQAQIVYLTAETITGQTLQLCPFGTTFADTTSP